MTQILFLISPRRLARAYVSWLHRLSKKLSRQGMYEWLENEFGQIGERSRVLTVGAGGEINDLLYCFATSNDFDVTSLDIDPQRSPDIKGDVCKDELPSLIYDVVVMAEVLEHLHAPLQGLDNVRNALKENGRLILTTPFILPIHDAPHDYFRFTKYGLALLLKKFSSVNIEARNNYFEAIDVLWARLLQTKTRRSLLVCSILLPLLFIIKKPVTWLLGSVVETDAMTTGYVVTATK